MFDFDLFLVDLKKYCDKNNILFDELPIVCQKKVIKNMLKSFAKSFNNNCKGAFYVE